MQASPAGRAMGSPAWQENAAANSGMFMSAPFARKRGSGCGSTVTSMRSYSGRAVVRPNAREAEKEALLGRKAVDRFCGSGLASQRALEGHVRDGQSAEIGDAFAEHQLAVFVQIVGRLKRVKLLFDARGALLEILAGPRGVHQLRRLPWASYWLPSSSKPWVISWPITAPMPP